LIEELYQTVKYEAVSLRDENLEEIIEHWTNDPEFLDNLPRDTYAHMHDIGAYFVYNTSTGAIAAVSPEALTLNFEESGYSDEFGNERHSVISKILSSWEEAEVEGMSDDYINGMNAVFNILMEFQTRKAD
jgi:hypothetical protein